MADEQQFRWLGPHKGIVQLALSSVTNACWDLWAKTRGLPLWKLLLVLTPEQIIAWSRENMANFKVPRSAQVVDALPRNPTGKVQKFKLREALDA